MSGRSRPLGRPRIITLGEVSLQTLRLAQVRAVTYLEVARELQLSRRHASFTVSNLAERGHLTEIDRRMVAEARKPVPVYRAAEAEPTPLTGIFALDWPRG